MLTLSKNSKVKLKHNFCISKINLSCNYQFMECRRSSSYWRWRICDQALNWYLQTLCELLARYEHMNSCKEE